MPSSLTARERRELTALRLVAQGIAAPSTDDPAVVVRSLLAMQAQDYPGALWSIGLRTRSATAHDVEAAHSSGAFVRSWPMRGTLHVVAAEDLGWLLSLTGERMIRASAGRRRQLGIEKHELDRVAAIARDRLSGAGRADRAELLEAFRAGGVPTDGQRGSHLLGHLAFAGLVVLSGRTEYALVAEHTPRGRELSPDEALDELAWRYYHGHGPATPTDLAWWSGLPLTVVRAATARVRDRLESRELGGVEYLLRPGLEAAADDVHALPGFDEYLLGYRDRSAALAPEHADAVVPGGNGMFLPTIVVRGEIAGLWRRDRAKGGVRVEPRPFGAMSATTARGFTRAMRRYGEFLGAPVEVAAAPAAGDAPTRGGD